MARMTREQMDALLDDPEMCGWTEIRREIYRLQDSEARLVEACKGLLFWGKPGVTFGDPSIAREAAEAAIKAAGS